jgi:hypothetical protein
MSFMSSTVTSQDGQAKRFTVSTTSLQAAQPALKTSTLRVMMDDLHFDRPGHQERTATGWIEAKLAQGQYKPLR